MELEFETVPIPGPKPRKPRKPRGPRKRVARPSQSKLTESTTFLCPNCDERFKPTTMGRWYCGLRCSAESEAVRYARKKLIEYPDGMPEDVDYAVRIQLAHALAGGYDKAGRRLSSEIRATVIKRDGGRCVLCSEPGEDIDHIDGPSDDLANLRLLCKDCHRSVTMAHLVPISDEATRERRAGLMIRIYSDERLRPCDDAGWNDVRTAWRREHTLFC